MQKKISTAFTLIELLVVSTIVLLVAGGGIAAFTNFNQKKKVVSGAQELQSYLRMAQSLARVGERPSGCNQLNGYQVVTSDVAGLKQVRLLASCSGGNVETKVFTLPEGVTLDSDLDITFLNLHGGVSGGRTIEVTDGESLNYQFEVTQGGEITEGEFL